MRHDNSVEVKVHGNSSQKITRRTTILLQLLFALVILVVQFKHDGALEARGFTRSVVSIESGADHRLNRFQSTLSCDNSTCVLESACVNLRTADLVAFGPDCDAIKLYLSTYKLRWRGDAAPKVLCNEPAGLISDYLPRAVLMTRYVEGQCGHMFGDEVWTSFRLALEHLSVDQIFQDGIGDLYVHRLRLLKCDDMFGALSSSVASWPNSSSEVPRKCYKHIYFGTKDLSLTDGYRETQLAYKKSSNFSKHMSEFRALFYRYAEVDTSEAQDTIVILQKESGDHLVQFHNLNELVLRAKSTFTSHQVVVTTWSKTSSIEQIRLMSRTAIFIGFTGSDLLSAVFMRDHAQVVVYCRMFDETVQRRSNEVAVWLQFLSYLNVVQYCDENVRHVNGTDETVHLNEVNVTVLSTLSVS